MTSKTDFDARIFRLWGIYALAFTIPYFGSSLLKIVALTLSKYIPVVRMQLTRSSELGDQAALYFGLLAVFAPIGAVYLMWREHPHERLQNNLNRLKDEGRSPEGAIAFAYLIGIPFAVGLLYLMLAAPVDITSQPNLAGPRLLSGSMNSVVGLIFIGSSGAIAGTLLIAGLYVLTWGPISKLICRRFK